MAIKDIIKENYKWIIFIFILAIVVRVFILVPVYKYGGENELLLGDGHYIGLAENLLSGKGYSEHGDGFPDAYRPPGYPMYLLIFRYFQIPLWVASVIQIMVASLIPVGVITLFPGFPPGARKIASLFAALEPIQVFYSVTLVPDVFFTVLFLAGLFFLWRWLEERRRGYVILAGFLVGLSNYFRPAAIYFGIFSLLAIPLFLFWKKKFSKTAVYHLALYALIGWLVIMPWQIRNYLVFGKGSFVSSGVVNLYDYGAGFTLATQEKRDYEEARNELWNTFKKEAPEPRDKNSLLNYNYLLSHSEKIIKRYPVSYFKTYLLGANTLLFSGNYHYLLQRYGIIAPLEKQTSFSLVLAHHGVGELFKTIFYNLATPYFILALGGKILWFVLVMGSLWGAWRMRAQSFSFIYFVVFLYMLVTVFSVTMGVEARHRYMLNPLIFLFFFSMLSQLTFKKNDSTISRNSALQ